MDYLIVFALTSFFWGFLGKHVSDEKGAQKVLEGAGGLGLITLCVLLLLSIINYFKGI